MTVLSKSGFILIMLLVCYVPLTSGYDSVDENQAILHSDSENGQWHNNTLQITGTTTLQPQTATWVLIDITEEYSYHNIISSGEFFSEVTPIDESLWSWSIQIDVEQYDCICMIQVTQPHADSVQTLTRVVFIGDGPHAPMLLPSHQENITLDGRITINAESLHSIPVNESTLNLSWCYSPYGACMGEIYNKQIQLTYNTSSMKHQLSIQLDTNNFSLTDGKWQFEYELHNPFLLVSPVINFELNVDETNPIAEIIAPSTANEGETVLFDGSGSHDGIWGSDLQSVWTVLQPDGFQRVATADEVEGMVFSLNPTLSGNYYVNLDVIDSVGRLTSISCELSVSNLPPSVGIEVLSDVKINSQNALLSLGEELILEADIHDTNSDLAKIQIQWFLDDVLISNTNQVTVNDLNVGEHKMMLVVTDDDGASDSQEFKVTVLKPSSDAPMDSQEESQPILITVVFLALFILGAILTKRNKSDSLPKWESASEEKE